MKKVVLALLLAGSISGLVKADPVVVNEPIIIMSVQEWTAYNAEVKKLYDAYQTLATQKSCKKA